MLYTQTDLLFSAGAVDWLGLSIMVYAIANINVGAKAASASATDVIASAQPTVAIRKSFRNNTSYRLLRSIAGAEREMFDVQSHIVTLSTAVRIPTDTIAVWNNRDSKPRLKISRGPTVFSQFQ